MATSKSAKRRNAQNRSKQRDAEKRSSRAKQHPPQHLPKVGTPRDDAYLRRRREADLVDFGLGRRRRVLPVVLIAVALLGVLALLLLLVLTD